MKYFLDTEFEPTPPAIMLSIAVVDELGHNIYYETEASMKVEFLYPTLFVRDKVLPRLYVRNKLANRISDAYYSDHVVDFIKRSDDYIRRALIDFVGDDPDPQFYAWYGAQDWVFIVQLFDGQFSNMPKTWPTYYNELKVLVNSFNITKEQTLEAVPKPKDAHFALADAMWNKQLFDHLVRVHQYAPPNVGLKL